MTRIIQLEITTDHDDTPAALQSVIANLSRAGYVVVDSQTYVSSMDEKPFQEYKFVTRHADVIAHEIDLYMELAREGASDAEDQAQD